MGPIVLLSGNKPGEEERAALKGFDYFLCKGERPDLGDVFAVYAQVRVT